MDDNNNFGNITFNNHERNFNSYQTQIKPIRVRNDKVMKLKKSSSMKAVIKVRQHQSDDNVPAVTMTYVEM